MGAHDLVPGARPPLRDFGSWLQNVAGLGKGARVALMMPNLLQYPVAIFGVLRAGLVGVNCNPLYTPRELEHQLNDSGAEAIVILENFAKTLEDVIGRTKVKTVVTTQIGDLLGFPKSLLANFVVKRVKKMVPPFSLPGAVRFPDALAAGRSHRLAPPPLGHDDIAFLQYTGGTTGVSKGAMLTHGNLVANLQQVSTWVGTGLEEGREVVITALPLYHIFALTGNCLTFMKFGARNVLIPNPRDMPGFVAELAQASLLRDHGREHALQRAHAHAGLRRARLLAPQDDAGRRDGRAARGGRAVAGGDEVARSSRPTASPRPRRAPASTRCRRTRAYNGTAGLPLPSTIVTIRDDDGNMLPIGQTGEICIAGPQVMKGYWNRPDETAKVMFPDGAFRTGDIGLMDERGYVKIVDRKKDMILVSGFNVYPNEVEDVVAMMPGVLEVCAVAAPDEKSGEIVRVVIVRKDPALTKEAVLEHCRKHLTGYKLPKLVEFWKELPKTNVGKVLRREVKNAPVQGS